MAENRRGSIGAAGSVLLAGLLLASPMVMPSASGGAKKPGTSGLKAGAISITAQAIRSFSKVNPLRRRFGRLIFLGGLTLSSPIKQFGGWSDIAIDADGRHMLAISDNGAWLSAALQYDGSALSGLTSAHIGPLHALSGRLLRNKRERDAEGLVLLDGTTSNGNLLISFERIHRIGRFTSSKAGINGPSGYLKLPAKAKKLRQNKGLEAVAMFRGGPMKGAVVTFAERPRKGRGDRPGWVFDKGRRFAIKLKDIGDFDVTSAAGLPDGSLLVLERRFRLKEWFQGIRIRLRRIKAGQFRPGAVVDGEILLQANSSHEVDNMEGLAVHTDATGRSIITMISDDNFNKYLQRTILLQFSLASKDLVKAGVSD